jgi:hypothetical protein
MAPKPHRFVQRIGGGEITLRRKRPVVVPEALFMKNLAEIKRLNEEGILEVRALTGELIDLKTMEAAAPAAPKPLPVRKLDSIVNDKPRGRPMPLYPEGKGLTEKAEVPTAMTEEMPEGKEPEDVSVNLSDTEPPPVEETPPARKSRSGRRKK